MKASPASHWATLTAPRRSGEQGRVRRRAGRLASNADELARTRAPAIESLRSASVPSLCGITEAMNERGIPSRRGGRWHLSNLRGLLVRLERAP